MAHDRRFRFALELHEPLPGRSWLDSFREVEDLGYSTLFFPDHLDEGPGPLAAVAAAAAVTTELTVGVLVLACDFRHPAFLARELATVDAISEGRLEVGLGAGWKTLDYTRSGIPMDPPGTRVSRLMEHTTVLKALLAGETVDFAGEHYAVEGLDCTPRPHRPGGPPILIGGGAPRLLRFAGAAADIVGVNASIHSGEIDTEAARDGLASAIDTKVGWVREGAGDRFDELELNAWLALVAVTDDPDGLAEAVAPGFGTQPHEVLASPLTLIGSPGAMAERLHERRERWGYSYHVLPGDQAHALAPIVSDLSGQ